MSEKPNEIVHQSTRLRILAALNALPAGERLEFVRLRAAVGATDGNLGTHLTVLEKAGYIQIFKDFSGRKPRTRARITRTGLRAFRDHIAYLRAILEPDADE